MLVDVNCVNRLSDGLASIAAKPPSVVLLDLNLPDSHGTATFSLGLVVPYRLPRLHPEVGKLRERSNNPLVVTKG